ncbi:MAG TPA: hypothetical protein VF282_09670 [Bacillota bacterium]
MNSLWGPGVIGRPDPERGRRAQRLIERFHAGLIDSGAYLSGLQALFSEEFAAEPAVETNGRPKERVAGAEPVTEADPVSEAEREPEAEQVSDEIRRRFPTREDAPGLWLVLADDRCHFCGRQIPVIALKPSGDDPGGWVHICLDDLELIRSQAEGALEA